MLPTPRISIEAGLRRQISPRVLAHLCHRSRRAGQFLAIAPASWSTLGLRIVADIQIAELHARYMGESGPTDVLSFRPSQLDPDDLGIPGHPGHPVAVEKRQLGDIILNWDAIRRQAQGTSSAAHLDEATVLIVHGLAHLLGHDHRDRCEGRRMFQLEQRVLRSVGLPSRARPYAPRLLGQANQARRT